MMFEVVAIGLISSKVGISYCLASLLKQINLFTLLKSGIFFSFMILLNSLVHPKIIWLYTF